MYMEKLSILSGRYIKYYINQFALKFLHLLDNANRFIADRSASKNDKAESPTDFYTWTGYRLKLDP